MKFTLLTEEKATKLLKWNRVSICHKKSMCCICIGGKSLVCSYSLQTGLKLCPKWKISKKEANVYHLPAPNTLWFTAYPAQMLPIVSSETLAAGWPRWSVQKCFCVVNSSLVHIMWLASWVIMVKVCSTTANLKCPAKTLSVFFDMCDRGRYLFIFSHWFSWPLFQLFQKSKQNLHNEI